MKKTIIALVLLVVLSIGATAQDAVLSSITEINKTMAEINNNITSMKTDIAVINTRLNTIESTLERQNNRMDVMDNKLDDLSNTMGQIQAIQTTTNTWLFWALGILVVVLGYFFVALRKLKPSDTVKDTYAFQPGSEPEFNRVRPKKRAKARPAT